MHFDQPQQVNELLRRHDRLIEDLGRLNEQIELTLASCQKAPADETVAISSDQDAPTY
jgi:hypothetical protein